jgi:hypothetical protein
MMRPLRSLDAPAGDELAAWELLRSVDAEVTLSELSAARILSRVNAEARRPARAYPRWLVAAAAVALSLLGLQVAMAAILAGVPALRHRLGAAVEHRFAHPGGVVAGLSTVEAPPPIVAAPVAIPSPAGSGARRAPAALPKAPHAEPSPVSSVPEVEVMTKAARALYADHDPLTALATLEPYLYLHPGGSLRPEMLLEAVQANLDLDRTPEALGLLDGMATQDFRGIPRASELRLLRAELLARSHRCREALPVFEQSLAAAQPLQRERALYGRAVCRAELGDLAGSRADLRAYVQQYPGGRFATEAERALDQ